MSSPERREGAVDLAEGDIRVRAGFRIVPGRLLAGGPVDLEFFVESSGEHPLHLAVSGDSLRQRPGGFEFKATFLGSSLDDPMPNVPYAGGPAGVVEVTSENPWRQPLVLNQFVRLEDTVGRLEPGDAGRIDLACRRPLPLAATDLAALVPGETSPMNVDLAFDLYRDDAALTALIDRLFDEIVQGPPVSRERHLTLLLSLRAAARPQIDALTRHADPSVAERARQALAESTG